MQQYTATTEKGAARLPAIGYLSVKWKIEWYKMYKIANLKVVCVK